MRYQLLAILVYPFIASAFYQEQTVFPTGVDIMPLAHSAPSLADLLTIESTVSIFSSYSRETELSALFTDESTKKTVFVPTNKAVMALARKPHQGPIPLEGGGVVLTEAEFDAASKENVERWVSAHVIPQSPIPFNVSATYDTLLEGTKITIEVTSENSNSNAPDWARVTVNDDVRITSMREASNGVMYVIDGTVKID